jgi:hypothetical protein
MAKRTTEETIAHTVKVKGIVADRSGINNTRGARAIIASEVFGVSQTLRNHGAAAVFALRNGDNVVVLSRVARKGRPRWRQVGHGSSTVITFARVLSGGKVSKVVKASTLAELCNKGARYIGTRANLYGNG